ncbi:hypothetical protein [Hyalangium sp.]|uniref:hypothetical protein n=1 Tax=Hyalangium sp. TaxID=2028555 RepID=UPI002D4392A2|nr:hypothetical protein [Hyalangium sp.]HYI01582.1 hypothetical protein [Hyalangium sp.]
MGSKSTSRNFPGFDKTFYLGESGYSRAFRGDLDVETDAFGLTRGEVHPAHPIRVDWAMGRAKPVDPVMWTTFAVPIIIADSVVQLLRSHGFTGWSLYEVAVHDKQGQLTPGYSGLAVTGRCGNIDWAQGIEVPRIRPAGIFPVWKGLFFDPASWDGSDFFMPAERGGYVLVVEEVKRAFERAKIRNVTFEPLDQFERSWKV